MKVLFILNVPSPYRLKFLEELGKRCDLTVLFERAGSSERDKSWNQVQFRNYKGVILNGINISTDLAFAPSVLKYLKEAYDYIFIADFLSPTGMLATRYLKSHHIPYILESDGGFVSVDSKVKKFIKSTAIQGATSYFSTGVAHDEYYMQYGVEAKRIVRYPFSSITEEKILKSPISADEKQAIREKLGILEKKIILYVGQFIHRKGLDILLKAYANCQNADGLYLIGGSMTEEYRKIIEAHQLQNVHFIEFQTPDVIADYYKAADVFVLPTRRDIWGLVVNEALSYGLPVITTTNCLAGLELVQGKNTGLLFQSEDVTGLTKAIDKILLHGASEYANASLEVARRYTIETMVEKHMEYISFNV